MVESKTKKTDHGHRKLNVENKVFFKTISNLNRGLSKINKEPSVHCSNRQQTVQKNKLTYTLHKKVEEI